MAVLPLSRSPEGHPSPHAAHSHLHPQRTPWPFPANRKSPVHHLGAQVAVCNSQCFGERIKGTDFYSKILEHFSLCPLEVLPCLCCLIIINSVQSCGFQRAFTSITLFTSQQSQDRASRPTPHLHPHPKEEETGAQRKERAHPREPGQSRSPPNSKQERLFPSQRVYISPSRCLSHRGGQVTKEGSWGAKTFPQG